MFYKKITKYLINNISFNIKFKMPIITQYFNVKISRLREKCSFFGLHIAGPGGTMQCCPLSMPRIHAYTQTQPSFIPPRPSKSNVQLINLASFCPFKRSNDVVFDRSKSKIHHIAVFFALPAPQPRRRAQTHSLTHTARRPRCELRSGTPALQLLVVPVFQLLTS